MISSKRGNLLAQSVYGRSKSDDDAAGSGIKLSKNLVTFSDDGNQEISSEMKDDSCSIMTQHPSDAVSSTSSLLVQSDTRSPNDGYGVDIMVSFVGNSYP